MTTTIAFQDSIFLDPLFHFQLETVNLFSNSKGRIETVQSQEREQQETVK